jgi:capsular polysaccharide transport system permease protein
MNIRNYLPKGHILFWLVVALPTVLSIIYNGFIYSAEYTSESRFVVKSASPGQLSLGSLIQGAGAANSQDALAVQSYIQSRDAMASLDHSIGLRAIYEKPDIDIFHRFPLYGAGSLEQFYEYYPKIVNAYVDPISSVVILTVTGFDKSKVAQINETLLTASEDLINRINDKMKEDIVSGARSDLTKSEDQFLKTENQLSAFQLKKGVIDPEREAALEKERSKRIQDTLLGAQTRLAEIRSVAPNSSQIKPLQQQIAVLQQSATETHKSAVGGSNSILAHSTGYLTRKVKRDLSVQQLANASQRLEAAILEASRRRVYLDRIAQPSQPDDSVQPRRIFNILATVLVALMAWGVLALLAAGFREHHE